MDVKIRELELVLKTRTSRRNLMDSPRAVFEWARDTVLFESPVEKFLAVYLDNKNRAAGWKLISQGTVSETIIHPREFFTPGLLCNCSSVIAVHNHPSGILTPSREDVETTRRLIEAGKILGIEMLDHIIVSDENYLSLKEEGYF